MRKIRLIFLTSIVGELLEHVILTGRQQYFEDQHDFLDHVRAPFPRFSTQDVLLQIKDGAMI